jgi:hypothetical protein
LEPENLVSVVSLVSTSKPLCETKIGKATTCHSELYTAEDYNDFGFENKNNEALAGRHQEQE